MLHRSLRTKNRRGWARDVINHCAAHVGLVDDVNIHRLANTERQLASNYSGDFATLKHRL